ncbi:MAG: hypothetical protein E7F27_09815 [Bifidobacterium breve]|jgi:hypothetical protein|nr:MAG: hypothetical protein Q620_VSAPLC00001G0052 [Veillonella sp. DORA_A_3_16_22]MDU3416320.1 hypothetical protein [Bifidobacterium breve]
MKNDYQNDLKELSHSSFNKNFSISISSFDGADSFGHCVLGGGASFVQLPIMRDAMKLDKYIDTTQTHMILNSTGGDLYAVTPLTVPFPKIYKEDAAIRLINNIAKEDVTIAIVNQECKTPEKTKTINLDLHITVESGKEHIINDSLTLGDLSVSTLDTKYPIIGYLNKVINDDTIIKSNEVKESLQSILDDVKEKTLDKDFPIHSLENNSGSYKQTVFLCTCKRKDSVISKQLDQIIINGLSETSLNELKEYENQQKKESPKVTFSKPKCKSSLER